MAKKTKHSTAEIQRLIEEKGQVERWLGRLDMTADKTPANVRDRVRSDYEARLDGVVRQLGGFEGEITESVEEHRTRRGELAEREAEASARLAEAELRHSVGEYDEGRWAEIRSGILEELVKVREELKGVDSEIAALEELLGAFEDRSEEEEEAAAAAAAAPDDAEASGQPRRPSKQTDAFDELAFLKSVTEVVAQQAGPERTPERRPPREDRERRGERPDVGAEGARAVETERAKPQKGSVQKSVKCAECGTLNLPTEWYCERCGAELTTV
jgi:hypothetical protein